MPDELRSRDLLADRIRLHRQVDLRPVAVVEGEGDERFLSRVISPTEIAFFRAGSRDQVIRTAIEIHQFGIPRVACVVDRDFDDSVAEAEARGLPIVPYDNADLESMLWWSSILDDVLLEVGSARKLESFGGPATVRDRVVELVLPLQRLRRASAVNGWGLAFDTIDLRRKIRVGNLALRRESLCDALWSEDSPLTKTELYEAADAFPEGICPSTGVSLIRGRDAIAAAGVLLRRVAGNLSFQEAGAERLAEIVRLRATSDALHDTNWLSRFYAQLGI